MQTAFTLLKSRRFSVNSFNECCFIHHTDESYSVFSSNGMGTVICLKRNRRIAALSHNRMKASKNEMSAYPIDRTTEATIRKSLTPKLKNYRKGNLLSYPPVMRQCLNRTVDLYQKKEELLASFL